MENYGKSGKSDYSKQQGRVSDWSPGKQLFQVPAFEQRAEFADEAGKRKTLQLKLQIIQHLALHHYILIKQCQIE